MEKVYGCDGGMNTLVEGWRKHNPVMHLSKTLKVKRWKLISTNQNEARVPL